MKQTIDVNSIEKVNKDVSEALEMLLKPRDTLQTIGVVELNQALVNTYVAISLLKDLVSESIENLTVENSTVAKEREIS